jgi:5-methylcytosine-specific restriction endonuclease McrA
MKDTIEFTLDRLPELTPEALITEMRRVAGIVGQSKMTISQFSEHSKVSVNTLRRRFGSWPAALLAAELAHLCMEVAPTSKSRTLARSMSDEEVLEQVRNVARVIGHDSPTADDLREHASIGVGAIRNRFGSLKGALRAAGLKETAHGRRYSEEECFENLLRVWTHYGRQPHHREMSLPPSEVGPKAYTTRWGTWIKALHAFVQQVNADMEVSEDSESSVQRSIPSSTALPRRPDARDRRDIPMGLRYTVLNRDRFKCVLCGDSPATTERCRLHVDHIVPFAKGGKTEMKNLRSLCESCNLGKGTKMETDAEPALEPDA